MINDIRTLINRLDSIEEGTIGAAIGGGLGGLAGSLLGPVGTVGGAAAGAALGSKVGDSISDFFSPTSKGHSTGTAQQNSASPSGYMAAGPDGTTMVGLTGAPDGTQFGQDYDGKPSGSGDNRIDKFGNKGSDYIPQPNVISVKGTIGLSSGGSFADEIQKLESGRGSGLKLTQSWDFKNSTLAILEAERGGEGRIWTNIASLPGFSMGDEMGKFYQKYGYKLTSDKDSVTSAKLGIFRTEEQHLSKGMLSKEIIIRNSFMLYAFQTSQGKGIHLIQVAYIGPQSDYQNGGLEAMNALLNSLEPTANVKPLTPKR